MSELTPYITVPDARAATDWYVSVLGARVVVEPIVMPDGKVGHTELDIGGARLMMADAFPGIQAVAPGSEGSPVTLHLSVTDVDDIARKATESGVELDRGPEDNPHVGRVAVFRDPFGHRWFLNQPPT